MKRFWLEFEDPGGGMPSRVGVTAEDLRDALGLVTTHWSLDPMDARPTVVVEEIDVSTLPEDVLQLVGVPSWRGVWYPVSSISAHGDEP